MTDSLERFLQDLSFDMPAGLVGRAQAAASVDRPATRPDRRDHDRQGQHWALALVAAVLALAFVATLLFGARSLHPKALVPGNPGPPTNAASCPLPALPSGTNYGGRNWDTTGGYPRYSDLPNASSGGSSVVPYPTKVVGPTTAWAEGGVLTTDDGAHWHDMSPAALRIDEPTNLSKTSYPPGFADYYLDANHAWETRTFSSATSCYDHIWTWATSDGGHTWRQSGPVILHIPPVTYVSLQLFFLDAQTGWLSASTSYLDGTSGVYLGFRYETSDGGRNWQLVSHVNVSAPVTSSNHCSSELALVAFNNGSVFSSRTRGWSVKCDYATAGLLTTRDGGQTWHVQDLPLRPQLCPCTNQGGLPTFFNERSGVVQVLSNLGVTMFATHDGGDTWQALPAFPALPLGLSSLNLAGANSFWALVPPWGQKGLSPPNAFSLYRSTDGGQTWKLVQSGIRVGPAPKLASATTVFLGFADDQHGLALASVQPSGSAYGVYELLKTSDGGHTWTVITPGSVG
jgi:photosystem II stability/assembly factor-like uncharacterized protein